MTHETFPFGISDILLHQYNTGYVYMILYFWVKLFTYIYATFSLRTRIQPHNSGNGSQSPEPFNLRPYARISYIFGFNINYDLMFHLCASVENTYK